MKTEYYPKYRKMAKYIQTKTHKSFRKKSKKFLNKLYLKVFFISNYFNTDFKYFIK